MDKRINIIDCHKSGARMNPPKKRLFYASGVHE